MEVVAIASCRFQPSWNRSEQFMGECMHNENWKLDTQHWPGPDRIRWGIDRDLVEPSPDGRFACVLYSCCEIRLGCDVGLLTLLGGPPESPTDLLQPKGFTCFDFSPRPSAQWLGGSRCVVVTAYLYRPATNRIDLLAFTFLDTATRAFAHWETTLELAGRQFVESGDQWVIAENSCDRPLLRLTPERLSWKPWSRMR